MSGETARSISGKASTIRQLFTEHRFILDTYQREYAWQEEHVADLINDLTRYFLPNWELGHEAADVAGYDPYFLGPVITYQRNDRTVLVDGQQRMTTLMLFLMWLDRLQGDRADAVEGLPQLIRRDQDGTEVFAVEDLVDERHPYLARLYAGESVDLSDGAAPSARNIVAQYENIGLLFPDDLRDDELPCFIYWLLDRVMIVDISTYSEASALGTFETMNDRGLRLTPLDLLKSFVLGKVRLASRPQVDQVWRDRLGKLAEADNNVPASFVKSWLRAKYSRNAADDDAIGGAPDKWLRSHHEAVGLSYPPQFLNLVVNDMHRLAARYLELLAAAKKPTSGLEPLYYNALNAVTLQFPLILAAVHPDDDRDTFLRKARMVAGFLDIYVARSMVSSKDYRQDSLANGMYALGREIRNQSVDAVAKRLGDEISALAETFDGVASLGLRPGNRQRVRYLLARLTAWVYVHGEAGASRYEAEAVRTFRHMEIEHIWADRRDYQPQVPARRFDSVRNRFGALVLLPKNINGALGAKRFDEKVTHYFAQNLLARSLHPRCYEANPTFRRLIEQYQLPFRPYDDFDEDAIGQRQKLYQRLCELVWDPQQYGLVVPATPTVRQSKAGTRTHFGVTLRLLVDKGMIPAEAKLVGSLQNEEYPAQLTPEGHITVESGETFESPSRAAGAVLQRPSWNGWGFWRVVLPDGTTPTLDAIRKAALKAGVRDEE